ATHTRVVESAEEVPRSATPARAGAQCNVDLCAAAYASFRDADCTYQPYDGGARRLCER
ncbi:MAG: BA14K family protein, partial [Alphaproteobacteria bacterium]|nr:BA14K family protein [Alphaproteobacteria bacterium]